MSTTARGNLNNTAQIPQPVLYTKEIQDLYIRTNFLRLTTFFLSQYQFVGFNFFEINVSSATTATQTLNHGLGFVPKDIVVTQVTGSGTINFLWGQFTKTTLSYTTTGACRVRFYVGTYLTDTSQVAQQSTDTESFSAGSTSAATTTPVSSSSSSTVPSYVKAATNYTLTSANNTVDFNGLTATAYATLPSAVGLTGVTFTLTNSDPNYTVILYSPGQTVGTRISGTIILAANVGDFITVQSNGSNWIILAKKETSFLSAVSSGSYTANFVNSYRSSSAVITLTPGVWRLSGFLGIISSTGTNGTYGTLSAGSGYYGADGANNNLAPAATGLPFNGFANIVGVVQAVANGVAGGASAFTFPPALVVVNANTPVYLVPQINSGASSTGTFESAIQAERVW